MLGRCDECRYALRQKGSVRFPGVLNCRRYPPHVMLVPAPGGNGSVQPASILPAVDDGYCCGEFEQGVVVLTTHNELAVK